MKRLLLVATLSLSVATALSGCVRMESGTAAPKTSPAATQAMTLKQAGETYERLAAKSNAARDAWLHGPELTEATLDDHRTLARKAAKVTSDFATSIRTDSWPAKARRPLDALRKDLEVRAAAYRKAAAAPTVEQYVAAARHVPLSSPAAAEVRRALEIPEAPAFCVCDTPLGPTAG
ncbi:hypothetical protein [Actinoplanes sp. NPDC049681]|uniref:hypothetical protein n=1 Tax=Actinoplanes sp. NPDC049681 TaxID=3363905 RepID=UPI00378AF1C2